MSDFFLSLEAQLNRVFFGLRNSLKLSRRGYVETPCRELLDLSKDVARKINALKEKYSVSFESRLNQLNALENYHLLDLLDQAKTRIGLDVPKNQALLDVGSKNFYYADALQSFFKPASLTGIELDAYKLYRDFHTRLSYAEYYVSAHKNARFLPMDFLQYPESAQGLTLFLPFVLTYPLIKWTLPLSTFQPRQIFEKAHMLLASNGWLLMTNQGEDEKETAHKLALAAGFRFKGRFAHKDSLLAREILPHVSLWKK